MSPKVPPTFISYCREDSEFALRLAEDLKAAGRAVWIDQIDIPLGERWDTEVERALNLSPRMLVILSPASVASSNVLDEVSFALSKQKSVIPILYRDCDVPFRLHRLQHVDFRNSYERGLKAITGVLAAPQQANGVEVKPTSQMVPLDEATIAPRVEEFAGAAALQAANHRDQYVLIEQRHEEIAEPDATSSVPAVSHHSESPVRPSPPALQAEDDSSKERYGVVSEAAFPRQDAVEAATDGSDTKLSVVGFAGAEVEPGVPGGDFPRRKIAIGVGAVVLIIGLALALWIFRPPDRKQQGGVSEGPVRSENGGVTREFQWKFQKSGARKFLSSVAFPTPQSGWATGGFVNLLHTEDGGATWAYYKVSGAANYLYSVAFPTPQSGWAVGRGGTILHTEDGGATWRFKPSGTKSDLFSVAFPVPQSGWVVGDGGTILHTEDGGETWKSQNSGTTAQLDSAAFPTPQSGWAVGDRRTILHTEDGGKTWNFQKSGDDQGYLDSVAFPTPRLGWAVGDRGTILHTEDGGETWNFKSGTIAELRSVAFPTPQSGWVVGDRGTILHTENGGATWRSQESGTEETLYSVAFPTPQSGWAVGDHGTILHTK